jgi:hypothetical protein
MAGRGAKRKKEWENWINSSDSFNWKNEFEAIKDIMLAFCPNQFE